MSLYPAVPNSALISSYLEHLIRSVKLFKTFALRPLAKGEGHSSEQMDWVCSPSTCRLQWSEEANTIETFMGTDIIACHIYHVDLHW